MWCRRQLPQATASQVKLTQIFQYFESIFLQSEVIGSIPILVINGQNLPFKFSGIFPLQSKRMLL